MTRTSTPLTDDASAPLGPALELRDASGEALTSSLAEIEAALRALGSAMQEAAHSLIPPGRIDESVANRYARAAEAWPRPRGGATPTYERQAELLGAFDDARATLRAAAECCRRTREILTSILR